jgi:hypothetical protein
LLSNISHIGRPPRAAFVVVEAGVVAAMTISTSSSYSLAETVSARHSLNLDFTHGRLFYGVAIVFNACGGGDRADPGCAPACHDPDGQRHRHPADGAGATPARGRRLP